ncbi:glycosyltransferase family 4 protein [Nocardioides sp. zg-1308]|uniref:Glycosyltransferase family 4 protein n=1 Tax=Nocardioides renjunii TaxID=3095075 RepID=A0ABU5K862_9ACTN|nr:MULTISPECIES: glycosyltransferase family 4 protein [unclassified Nocardioides]MDZ5661153.1 glycosyltransferase family 4 protein [Nocardioides sp. S-58]NPD04270.1 glycosyltransferase family 4 protein [Nocardioides sp. zg-1308]
MDATTVAAAALASVVVTGVVAALLPRLGVVDVPNHRSSHARPVPRGGGIGVVAGLLTGLLVSAPDQQLAIGLAAAVALAVLGFVDDVRSLPALLRLVAQVVVAALAAAVLVRALDMDLAVGITVTAAATLWLTGYVNVFNFMDGSNGLAGLSALIAGATFAWVGWAESEPTLLVGGSVLLGAAAGFLPWNFPVARIFLGDVGSYSTGFLVAWLGLVGVLTTDRYAWCLAPTVLVLLDTSLTLVRRARRGESLMEAHREHVYQRLTTVPGSPLPAIVTALFGAAFVASAALPPIALAVTWMILGGAYVAMPHLVGRTSSVNA